MGGIMAQIINSNEKEWLISSIKKPEKEEKLEWLFISPQVMKEDLNLYMDDLNEDIKVQVGSHYYWIRLHQSVMELCRMTSRKDSLILYEVLQHENLGITDDDLEYAIYYANREPTVSRQYRISDQIKGKLQNLYEY